MVGTVNKRLRKRSGLSTVEMAAGLVVLVPVFLVLFDIGCLIVSNLTNDTVCRDITRAVAAGDPKDATARAQKLVALQNQKKGNTITNYVLVGNPQNSADISIPPPDSGGLVRGSVTCRTRVDVRPPFLVGAIYNGKAINFDSEQTFPYTYFVKATGDDPN